MKIYFTASIGQRKQLYSEYQTIMETIGSLGHQVVTAYDVLEKTQEEVFVQSAAIQERFFQTWQQTISEAEIAVIEASFPSSVHIGTEIGALIQRGKPLICLYKPDRNPIFINELHTSRLVKAEYTVESIREVLEWAIDEAEQMLMRRFTLFISSEMESYLDTVTSEAGVSKSEQVRKMIGRAMKEKKNLDR